MEDAGSFGQVCYPSWSPDGRQLVYQRDVNGSAIYVLDLAHGGQRGLSPVPGMDVTPSWSPDGEHPVYARLRAAPQPNHPPQADLRVMNADGSGDHAVLSDVRFAVEPRWSVSGRIVFMSLMRGDTLDLYTMKSDGTDVWRLTQEGNSGDPVWSRTARR